MNDITEYEIKEQYLNLIEIVEGLHSQKNVYYNSEKKYGFSGLLIKRMEWKKCEETLVKIWGYKLLSYYKALNSIEEENDEEELENTAIEENIDVKSLELSNYLFDEDFYESLDLKEKYHLISDIKVTVFSNLLHKENLSTDVIMERRCKY
ncbi:MAG: hypothetical protein GY756_15315 [bacterium]|nr:hypothetical protein [bacterium]